MIIQHAIIGRGCGRVYRAHGFLCLCFRAVNAPDGVARARVCVGRLHTCDVTPHHDDADMGGRRHHHPLKYNIICVFQYNNSEPSVRDVLARAQGMGWRYAPAPAAHERVYDTRRYIR